MSITLVGNALQNLFCDLLNLLADFAALLFLDTFFWNRYHREFFTP
tara:strand:- start:2505 stop:2642 length:138 start_codon:yes stop_codon:yes gene_type:complete